MAKIFDMVRFRAFLDEHNLSREQGDHLLADGGWAFISRFVTTSACGARCRDGHPCRAPARKNGRCRIHGGLSTGPRTVEGRRRISEMQRTRPRHTDKKGKTGPKTPEGIDRIRRAQYLRWARWEAQKITPAD